MMSGLNASRLSRFGLTLGLCALATLGCTHQDLIVHQSPVSSELRLREPVPITADFELLGVVSAEYCADLKTLRDVPMPAERGAGGDPRIYQSAKYKALASTKDADNLTAVRVHVTNKGTWQCVSLTGRAYRIRSLTSPKQQLWAPSGVGGLAGARESSARTPRSGGISQFLRSGSDDAVYVRFHSGLKTDLIPGWGNVNSVGVLSGGYDFGLSVELRGGHVIEGTFRSIRETSESAGWQRWSEERTFREFGLGYRKQWRLHDIALIDVGASVTYGEANCVGEWQGEGLPTSQPMLCETPPPDFVDFEQLDRIWATVGSNLHIGYRYLFGTIGFRLHAGSQFVPVLHTGVMLRI